jgi:hypothetical protein
VGRHGRSEHDGVADSSSTHWSCPCLLFQYLLCPRLVRRWIVGVPGSACRCWAVSSSLCSRGCPIRGIIRGAALPAGRAAGDRGLGDCGRDAWLCRVRHLGTDRASRCVGAVGYPVSHTEREDLSRGVVSGGSRRPQPPAGCLFHHPRGRVRPRAAALLTCTSLTWADGYSMTRR